MNLTAKDMDTADSVSTLDKENVEVKLLTATLLPNQQAKVVKVQASNNSEANDVVFEPYKFLLDDQRLKLVMTEALIEPNKEGCVKL